jgi:hypothetical protein
MEIGTMTISRVTVIVLDGVGAGEAPDAAAYGDIGSNSLGNTARAVGGLKLPNLEKIGFGYITPMIGVARVSGRLADIALLRQDGVAVFPRFNPAANLVYSSRSSDVDTVLCNGKLLLRGGRLLTIDKAEVKRQISERLAHLSERVPGRRIATYPT